MRDIKRSVVDGHGTLAHSRAFVVPYGIAIAPSPQYVTVAGLPSARLPACHPGPPCSPLVRRSEGVQGRARARSAAVDCLVTNGRLTIRWLQALDSICELLITPS